MIPPSVADVAKVAALARIRVDDAEVQRLSGDVARVLEYVELLFAVDVEGVEPLRQPPFTPAPLRTDEPRPVLGVGAIAGSAGASDGLVRVPKVLLPRRGPSALRPHGRDLRIALCAARRYRVGR